MPSYVLKRINGTKPALNGERVGALKWDGGSNITGVNGAYFRLPKSYPLANANTWEFKFNALNIAQGGGNALVVGAENNHGFFVINVYESVTIYLSSNDTSWDIANATNTGLPYNIGKSYYYKVGYDGTQYYTEYNTDGSDTYTRTWSLKSDKKITGSGLGTLLGYGYITNGYWANATVDLTKCSLTVDGEVVWTGMKQVPKVEDYVLKRKINKYYKDTVTTKYWKEVETTVNGVAYACYYGMPSQGIMSPYIYYVKTPLGSDTTLYFYSSAGEKYESFNEYATDVSQLYPSFFGYTVSSVTETTMTFSNVTLTRQSEHDLYADVPATTVVEGTPDDYTYTTTETETVEVSANDDYDRVVLDSEPAYLLKTIKYRNVLQVSEVGSLAKVNKGVAGAFSASNYLTLPEVFRPENNIWEICFKVTTGSDVSTSQSIMGNYGNSYQNAPEINLYNGLFILHIPKDGSNTKLVEQSGTYQVLANTTYFVKIGWTGTEYYLDYSTDGVDYIRDVSVANSTAIYQATAPFLIGMNLYAASSTNYWRGSIDLNQSCININGERWWSGNSYTKVGSWIDYDKFVVSGFSASDYVTIPVSIPTYGYELVFGMQTGSDVTTQQAILGSTANDNSFMFSIKNGKFVLIDKINGVEEGNCSVSGGTVTANTSYLVKFVNTGTKTATPTELYYSTDNGATFTLACTIAGQDTPWLNPCPFGVPSNRDSTKAAFTGLIDFTNAYLKSGDEVIWSGVKAEKY